MQDLYSLLLSSETAFLFQKQHKNNIVFTVQISSVTNKCALTAAIQSETSLS